jgi:gluconolactonase
VRRQPTCRRERGSRQSTGRAWPLVLVATLVQGCGLPPADGAAPETVANLDGYSEGIAFDAAGNAYISLQHRAAVLRIPQGGSPERWLTVDDPNGHRILPDGTHLIAARAGVLHVAPDGRVLDTVIVERPEGPALLPNDIALDGHGGYYLTAPADREEDRAAGSRVFYVDSTRQVREVARGFLYPNGIVVRADGRVLLLNDGGSNAVYRFDITAPGEIQNQALFASLPDSGRAYPDGMALDDAGRLYVAHYGAGRVEVLDQDGRLLRRYPTGQQLPSNVAFGGPGLRDLYVTGSPADEMGVGILTRLPLGVPGRSSRSLPRP